eukprot:COSAG06_NODE_6548_length_2886_cov_8.556512_2_plen_167_part_00
MWRSSRRIGSVRVVAAGCAVPLQLRSWAARGHMYIIIQHIRTPIKLCDTTCTACRSLCYAYGHAHDKMRQMPSPPACGMLYLFARGGIDPLHTTYMYYHSGLCTPTACSVIVQVGRSLSCRPGLATHTQTRPPAEPNTHAHELHAPRFQLWFCSSRACLGKCVHKT